MTKRIFKSALEIARVLFYLVLISCFLSFLIAAYAVEWDFHKLFYEMSLMSKESQVEILVSLIVPISFLVVIMVGIFWSMFKPSFPTFAFGSLEEPMYSFQSGDTLEETIKKIEAVVKENAYLKKQLSDKEIDTTAIVLSKIDFSKALKGKREPFFEEVYKKFYKEIEGVYKAAILAQKEYSKRLKITSGDAQENLDYKVTGIELQQIERLCISESMNLKLCNTCCFNGGCATKDNIKNKYQLLNYGCSSHLGYLEKMDLEFEISKELKKKEHNFLAIVKGNIVKGNNVPNNWNNTIISGDIIMGSAMRNTTNEIDDLLSQLGIDEDNEETLEKIVECAVAILSNNTKFISESER